MSANTKYAMRMAGAFVLYAVFIVAAAWFLRSSSLSQPVQVAVALAATIPGVLVAWVIVRQVNAMDEFQRKVHLESLAIAGAGTALATMSYGFLEAIGFPRLSMFYVWGLMGVLWSVTFVIQNVMYMRGSGRA